ncbi:sulfatase-like hydrolase/transferase [Pontiella desulfatans]|uniref:sulfatase-like hydrolase/transferase n=1 Tax=Pontiella desulfatans TaxID=2750659 RepID=UPI0014448B10|nr:sulfatase-like hydrolase/transferase [Pontiella desulfatans]
MSSLLEVSIFSSDPCDPALPTSGINLIKYNNDGLQWASTAASVAGDDFSVSLIKPNLLNDTAVTSDPDYNPATTKLTAITPDFVSGSIVLASTANLDPLTQIDAFYTITITTTGATFSATSGTATILDGSRKGSSAMNNAVIADAVASFNTALSWDTDPFAAGGLTYDSISSIEVTYSVNTIVPNSGASNTSWCTLKSMPINYTAETVYTAPTYDLSVGLALTNGAATDLIQLPAGSNAVFGASSDSYMEISKSGALRSADQLKTDAAVVCDGTLNVVLVPGSDPLAAGDAFDLFEGNINGAITGMFSAVNLPTLSAGLEWTTNTLYTQGFIWVRETNTVAVAKPNVIILFADDLGYADAGFQPLGSADIVTPHIDSIANNGAVFTAGYANGPVCSPSRGGLMTGQYQNRFALHDTPATWHMEDPENPGEVLHDGIPVGMTCFGHRMQDLGYATCMIGKWHGGESREHYPPHRGFDEFFGFNNGATSYYPGENDNENLNRRIMRGMFPVEREDEYITDAFGREAVSFINRHAHPSAGSGQAKPFFLYVPFNAPHGPMTASDEHSQILFGKNASELTLREKLVSMVYSMDLAVGDILDAVRTNGLMEKTLIVFYSDNGGIPSGNGSENTPLRGEKGELWDGGIRVPFCMQWKGQVPAGISYDFVVSGLDLMPTAVELAGGSFTTNDIVDGNNLMAAVTGQTGTPPNDIVLWWHNDKWVARDNEWKLIDLDKNEPTPPELYHILSDISETTDLYGSHPAEAARLYDFYTNTVAEFDLVTDASKWSSNATYYINITDPAQHVINESTNLAEWVEAEFPGTDADNDGIDNYNEFMLGLPPDESSALTNALNWNMNEITSGHLDLTFNRRTGTVGENNLTFPAAAMEETGSLTTGLWSNASATLIDGPNPASSNTVQETFRIIATNSLAYLRLRFE